MARYTGPVCKLCRREKTKLFLKGTRCESPKCPIEKGRPPPGEHGRGRVRESEYLLQLREKQKAKRFYGILEKQFRTLLRRRLRLPRVSRAKSCCASANRVSTTSCTARLRDEPPDGPSARVATVTSRSTVAR